VSKSEGPILPRTCDRIVLRRLAVSDLANFQAYRHDPEVGRYQGWSPLADADALAFLVEMGSALLFAPGQWCQIGIADRVDDALIGDIGLHIDADAEQAEIGFSLSRQYQGRGLGVEAVREAIALVFAHTAAARVLAITDARNTASTRLLERVGMHRVETQQVMFRGEPCVEHVFAIERSAAGP